MSAQTYQFEPRTCPKCQRNNAAFALICVHCGAELPASEDSAMAMADVLAERLKSIAEKVQETYTKELSAGSLVLYVPADDAAIVLQKTQRLVLGRTATKLSSEYDLSPYNAYTLGVSRRHAMVSYATQGYAIKDLGSANGTWVNSCRLASHSLHYVKNTDQIWLGQLILLAYTDSPGES